jgi:hypothetical protein
MEDVADDFTADVAPVSLPPTAELPEIKLFGRWSCDDVQVSDMSLQVGLLCMIVGMTQTHMALT